MNAINVNTRPPSGYSQQQQQAALNNSKANALALGDTRQQLKQGNLIRPGMSIGRAQRNQANVAGSQQMSEAIAAAYGADLQNSAYNAQLGLQGQSAQEGFSQALGGLQQQNNYAAQSEALQRQNMMTGMFGNILGGLLR